MVKKKKSKESKSKISIKKIIGLFVVGVVLLVGLILIFSYLKTTSDIREGEVLDCGGGTAIYLDEKLCWEKSALVSAENWKDADEYCESLVLGEKDDWRLPSLIELGSIVEKSFVDISINDTVFDDTLPKHYWTSTRYEFKDNAHWYVHFEIGHQGYAQDFVKNYGVRCVRDNLAL